MIDINTLKIGDKVKVIDDISHTLYWKKYIGKIYKVIWIDKFNELVKLDGVVNKDNHLAEWVARELEPLYEKQTELK